MIKVESFNAHPRLRFSRRAARLAAMRALRREGKARVELRIVFVDDATMVALNGEFLHHRTTTDVLTFPIEMGRSRALEAEIYVNADQARRQAREENVGFREEMFRLIIHGILHLSGYDDRNPAARRLMSRREDYHLRNSVGKDSVHKKRGLRKETT